MASISLNSNLNLQRSYSFTFFNITGSLGSFALQNIPDATITNSINVHFEYTITNNFTNTAKFVLYNASNYEIQMFTSQSFRRGFVFNAWYGASPQGNATIFVGAASIVSTYRNGADIITEITASDLITNYLATGLNLSYPNGATALKIVNDALTQYQNVLSLDDGSKQFLIQVNYNFPVVFTCTPQGLIDKIANDSGLLYFIQNNIVYFYPGNLQQGSAIDVGPPTTNFKLSKQTGLVGYPRPTSLSRQLFPVLYNLGVNLNQNLSIVSITSLLRRYTANEIIYLESEFFTGNYRILNINYTGEWRGNPWYSNLSLYPIA